MSCSGDTRTLLNCIEAVCNEANAHVADIRRLRDLAQQLREELIAAQQLLSCVLTGDDETACSGLPSLAAALAALNACSITSIATETATATAGQATWTLSTAPASIEHLDVAINGAHAQPWADYTLSGDTITFTSARLAGDALTAWRFIP